MEFIISFVRLSEHSSIINMLQYLQARTSKTLDSEMASLKFDKNAPVAHTSAVC
jgi:hypothetical protein